MPRCHFYQTISAHFRRPSSSPANPFRGMYATGRRPGPAQSFRHPLIDRRHIPQNRAALQRHLRYPRRIRITRRKPFQHVLRIRRRQQQNKRWRPARERLIPLVKRLEHHQRRRPHLIKSLADPHVPQREPRQVRRKGDRHRHVEPVDRVGQFRAQRRNIINHHRRVGIRGDLRQNRRLRPMARSSRTPSPLKSQKQNSDASMP